MDSGQIKGKAASLGYVEGEQDIFADGAKWAFALSEKERQSLKQNLNFVTKKHTRLEADHAFLSFEKSKLKEVISSIWWMARHYAHGRQSYAVGMYNDAIKEAQKLGMEFKPDPVDGLVEAKDGGFDKEWFDNRAKAIEVLQQIWRDGLTAGALKEQIRQILEIEAEIENPLRELKDESD